MSEKAIVLEAVRRLPEDATLDEIVEAVAAVGRARAGGRSETPPTRIDEELADFIASGPGPRLVAEFRPSEEARRRVADLIAREKTSGLSADETSELDRYLQIEHLMRLAKARARRNLGDE